MKRYLLFPLFCLLTLCVLFSTSCRQVPEQKPFPQEYRLHSERISQHYFIDPYSMELKNGFLVFCSSYIQIFSAIDYAYLRAFGGRHLPNGFQLPQIVKSSSPFLYVMDVNHKNEIRKYQIDSTGQPILLQSCFAGISSSMNRPYILHDSLIVYDEFIPEASIKIHNLFTNSTECVLPYGTTSYNERFFDKNMGGLYANDSCIVFAYKYQDRIDFFDWKLNLKKSVNNQQKEPEISIPNWRNNISYYGNSYMGQNYFYTLYRGVSNKVFRSDSLLNHQFNNFYLYGITRDVLEVYEFDGKPVCRYYFEDVAPGVFAVDEELNKLVGFRIGFENALLVYQLQGLPKNGSKNSGTMVSFHGSTLPFNPEPVSDDEVVCFGSIISSEFDITPSYFIYACNQSYPFHFLSANRTSGASILHK